MNCKLPNFNQKSGPTLIFNKNQLFKWTYRVLHSQHPCHTSLTSSYQGKMMRFWVLHASLILHVLRLEAAPFAAFLVASDFGDRPAQERPIKGLALCGNLNKQGFCE
jgi:hypothetical protein